MMLRNISWPEIIVVLVIVLLVFGVGRISKIAGELGSGIRAFKEGLSGESDGKSSGDEQETAQDKETED